jgi:hypothetical protein
MTPDAPPAASRLTDNDRGAITQARELAALRGIDAIRAHVGETDAGFARVVAFGEAQHWLSELVRIAERLGGTDG